MAEEQITKKQHIIPKFYLKTFADNNEFLQVFDIANNRFGKPRPYPALGYEPFFYANETGVQDRLSQEVEKWLQHYETILSEKVSRIIPKILAMEQLGSDDKYLLSALMCMLWLRSPQMRNSMNKMRSDLAKQILSMKVEFNIDKFIEDTKTEITQEQKESVIKTFEKGEYGFRFSNAHHVKMMVETFGFGNKGFTNLFFAKKWKIFIAKGKDRFITSDSPVVEWWPPPQGMYSATFLERNNYFALSPQIFIELSVPQGSTKINRSTLFDGDKDLIRFKNIMIASHANKYIYSGNKDLLAQIIDGRNNPGAVELDYIRRFEFPWKEYMRNQV